MNLDTVYIMPHLNQLHKVFPSEVRTVWKGDKAVTNITPETLQAT